MNHGKLTGLVLNDFVKVYSVIEAVDELTAIKDINAGWCGMVASIVGYLLTHRYKVPNVEIHSHAHHIWLHVNGKDYDTMFPEGYSKPVIEVWKLKQNGWNTEIVSVKQGDEANKGWWDWGFIAVFKAMFDRHQQPYPDYFDSYIKGAERFKGKENLERKAITEKRLKVAMTLPVVLTGEVKRNKLLPETFENND